MIYNIHIHIYTHIVVVVVYLPYCRFRFRSAIVRPSTSLLSLLVLLLLLVVVVELLLVVVCLVVDIYAAVVSLYTNSTSPDSKYTILFLFALTCLSVRCCLGNGGPCWSICKACIMVILYILLVVSSISGVNSGIGRHMCCSSHSIH